jgi:glycosyltransferase involved in cell wall biosynthesis
MEEMKKRFNFFWGSSYDRGLDIALFMWPDIIKKYPDAEFHICYGWDLYDIGNAGNPERMEWKKRVSELMDQPGITHHGRVGKDELKKIRKECGIWLYPTYFTEINCITALEAQKDGLVPVTTDLAALKETVGSGFKIEGNIRDIKVLEEVKKAVFKLLDDPDLWKKESKKAQKFAKNYFYDKIATKWEPLFTAPEFKLVTIYTPTVREGWWRVMAENIASQTHDFIEWIIVDDHKEDRSEIAKKMADFYGLDIKYMKGKKRKTKRTYSLINANNTAIEAANGSLFVFLQDFVLMQPDAIERLVDLHRHNPTAFIAPVDQYNEPKVKPNTSNSIDWFDGEVDAVGDFIRENVRQERIGLRESHKLTDFEQNFGAVATQTLRDLGGYYEFFDEALGYDDTEIIYRAWGMGYKLLVDDSVVATCIDHWGTLGKDEGGTGVNRTRRMNDPRMHWMMGQIKDEKLPLKRTQEIDDKIELLYEVPEEIADEDCEDWMKNNVDNIVEKWL